jgi:two-component system alkaline phosphatase synthesis response regulator PhoP
MGKKKILIVDDEEDIIKMLKIRLEANNYEILSASDGQEGLNKARQERPDLIILDLMLPKIDGHKVCRMLKFDENYKNIPIIMFTAKVDEKDRDISIQTKADAFISKPFEIKMLLDKVSELLNKSEKGHIVE